MSWSNRIKHRLLPGLAIAMLALSARSAMAQLVINFDEFGKGTISNGAAGTVSLISMGNIVDPVDPTNGLLPLAYNLPASLPGFIPVPGDIDLVEPPPAPSGQHTDLLRFTPNGLLLVYSDLPDPGEFPIPLADVGFPATGIRQPNNIILLETGPEVGPNGLFGYIPGAGMPGQVSAPVTYNFTSDPAPVPEPDGLAIIAPIAVALMQRRRR